MYNDLEAELHDLFWESEGASAELPLIKDFLQAYSGTALELGCGSGRLLLPLIEDGYLIEGLDNSAEMLKLCAGKSASCDPILHEASIEDFQTGVLYGAITIPAFTLQFISSEKLPDVLENIRKHLHPGGALYLTTFIPWAEITGDLEEGRWLLDHEVKVGEQGAKRNTAKCHTRFMIKRFSQELIRNHRYKVVSPQGKTLQSSESTHKLTWYWKREMEMILSAAGFTVEKTIGDFDLQETCHEDSQIITIIATTATEPEVDVV